jgi:hypothetical protein
VYYYDGLALQGMKNPASADSFKSYLGIRGQSTDDPLVADIKHQIGQ